DQGVIDVTSAFLVTRRLHDEQTPFQHLEVYDSPRFGRMLLLDGAAQTTEGDEFAYHEMLAHPALCARPHPRRVLILRGGDGALVGARLTPDGVLAVQSGSAVYQQELIRSVRQNLRPSFPVVRTAVAAVMAYPGVLWSFTIGAKTRDPGDLGPEEIAGRLEGFRLRYCTPAG